jgi:hypothetical protein
MRPALTIPTATVLVLLACSGAGAAPVPQPIRAPLSWTARPAGPAALTPQEQLWFDRLLAALSASEVLANNAMTTGDAYELGRTGGDYIESLLMAFRATGDVRFLDRVYELSERARGSLRDAWLDGTTDGYTSWLWLIDPTNATYYGKDINWLDESISSGNAALWAWALHANRGLDPRYGVAADFWRNWLENQFLAKWYARAGGNPLTAWNTPYAAFYKPDTEPRSANWRLAHYLWRLTGNTFYRDRDNQIVAELSGANHVNPAHPQAFRWTKETDPNSINWQPVNYANYYMRAVLEMDLEGMPFFSDPVNMKRFAATFRDVVYAATLPARTTMTNNVNGDGSIGYALYAFNGFSAWDSTGFLMNLADLSITGAGNYAGGGTSKAARNDVYMSAYALMSLSPMGPTATLVRLFQASPLDDGSVRIEWELSSSAGDVAANLYRIAPEDAGRTLVNAEPVEGTGRHELVDRTPGDATVLTYELDEVTASGERLLQRLSLDRGARVTTGVVLGQNAPNPFGSTTTISFDVPRADHVRVAIHDSAGRLVRVLEDGQLPAGRYSRLWDGCDAQGRAVPSGTYFYSAESSGQRVVRRAIRVK